MNKRVMVEGKSFSVFKGHFAKVTKSNVRGQMMWSVCLRKDGRLQRKHFPIADVKGANAFAREKEAERLAQGQFAVLREEDRLAVAMFRRWESEHRIKGENVPDLSELVAAACARYDERMESATWGRAAEDFLQARGGKWTEKRGAVVRSVIARFSEGVDGGRLLDDFSPEEVGVELARIAGKNVSTRRAYATILSMVWKFAMDQGLARRNPAQEAIKRMAPAVKPQQPSFLSIADCRRVLDACAVWPVRAEALFFVIGLLTGIRSAERSRLQWRDFRLDESRPYINIPAGKAKTNRQRAVYLYGSHAGIIRALVPVGAPPEGFVVPWSGDEAKLRWYAWHLQERIGKAAGVVLPRNVLRHTAATYLCAFLESAGKAALILGHSEKVHVENYRALATKAEGEEFFNLQMTIDK